jgi:hypothetical protein
VIYKIETPEQAEKILRDIAAAKPVYSFTIFDISEKVELAQSIPLILRVCKRCEKPAEYLGWNIWGKNFEKRSTYCTNCGYSMDMLAQVDLAIQGERVINTAWR